MGNRTRGKNIEKLGSMKDLVDVAKEYFEFHEWQRKQREHRQISWAVIKGAFITTLIVLGMEIVGIETSIPYLPWIVSVLTVWMFFLFVLLGVFQLNGMLHDIQQLSQSNHIFAYLFSKSEKERLETARYIFLLADVLDDHTEVFTYRLATTEEKGSRLLPGSYLEKGLFFQVPGEQAFQVAVNKGKKELNFFDFWSFDTLSGTRSLLIDLNKLTLKAKKEAAN